MIDRKRIVAVLLAFLMIFEMLPVTAVAEGWTMLMSNVLQGDTYHTVTFTVEGKQIASQYVKAGEHPVIPENPAKAEDRENNKAYVFAGWYDGDTQITAETAVNSDVNAAARFDAIGLYKVTVKYVIDTNSDGVDEAAANTVVRWYTSLDTPEEIKSPVSVVEGTMDVTYIPDRSSVVINPAELTGNTEIIVRYHTTDTTYTIYHQVRNPHYGEDPAEPQYTELYVETGDGLIGSTVFGDALTAEEFETLLDMECHYNYVSATSVELTGNSETDFVTVIYEPHLHALTYDSQDGSYIAPETKHCHETVTVYTVVPGTDAILCGMEEHTHTEKPTSTQNVDVGTVRGCYTVYRNENKAKYWGLSCGKTEHTHSDACNGKTADVYTPAPTRQGYIFGGWYLDAACKEAAPATMRLEKNTTVYAKWTPGQADYIVVYWAENVEAEGLYNYIGSVVHTGTVGDTVGAAAATFNSSVFANQQYYHFDSDKTKSAVVKADGTAVVNAYFMLNEYNLTFNFSQAGDDNIVLTMDGTQYTHDGTQYTFKAKYGQDISTLWPTAGNFSHTSNSSWDNNFYGWGRQGSNTVYASKRLVLSADMIGNTANGSTTTYNSKWNAKNKFELHYMLQNTDGNGYTDSPDYRQHNALSDSDRYNQKDIAGFKKETTHEGNGEVVDGSDGLKHIYFYYTRETYNVDYYYGSTLLNSISDVRFGKNLSNGTFTWTPTTVQAGLISGYTFVGWYDNIACEGEPYFNTIGADGNVIPRTMPAGNLVLYAKFVPPDRTITLKNAEGTFVTDDNGNPISVTVSYGEVPAVPTPVREGYTFLGWFTAPDGGKKYDTNKPLTENITVFAHWQLQTISLTVRYWTLDSTEENYTQVLPDLPLISEAFRPGEEHVLHAQYAEGYRPTEATQSIVLTVGDNYVTFRYVKREPVKYTVKYVLASDPTVEIQKAKTVEAAVEVGRVSEIAPALITDDGQSYYYPTENAKSLTLTADETKNIITFQYVPYKTANVEVQYWYPKADGTGYEQRADLKGSYTVTGVRVADSVYAANYQANGEVNGYVFDADKTETISVTVESADAGKTLYLKLYYKLGFTNLTIGKKVVDSTPDAAASTDLVFVFEVSDGTGKRTVKVKAGSTVTVENLPLGATYTITEVGVDGKGDNALAAWATEAAKSITLAADASQNKVEFTNTRRIAGDTAGVTATKTWEGDAASSAQLQLYRSGSAYLDAVTVNASAWSYTWNDLPAYDLDGNAYTYTVKESGAANGQIMLDGRLYNVTESGLTVNNAQKKGAITVSLTDKTVTYSGAEQSVDAAAIEGGPADLTLDGLNATVSGGKGTDVGSYPGDISGDATYLGNDGVLYTVTYIDATLTITPAPVTVTADDKTKVYGADDPVLTATVTGLKGNDAADVIKHDLNRAEGEEIGSYPISVTGDAEQGNYTVTYVPGTLTITGMVVEHYLEQLDGSYRLAKDAAIVGVPAGTYQDDDYTESFEGYTYVSGAVDNVTSVTVTADAAPVMKLYYKRASFKVTYEYEGAVPAGATALPAEATCKYGETVAVAPNATATGYVFSGWSTADAAVENGQFAMPAKDVVIKGSFIAATNTIYKVEYYLQDTDANGNPLTTYTLQAADTESKTGTTGTAGEWSAKTYANHTYEKTTSTNEQNGQHIILADGTLVIKVHYTRDMITLTLAKDVVDTTADAPAAGTTFEISYSYAVDGKTITGEVELADNQSKAITLPKGGKLTVDENVSDAVWKVTGEGEYTLDASQAVTITNTRRLFDPDGPDGEDPLGEIRVEKHWHDVDGTELDLTTYVPKSDVGIQLLRSIEGGEATVYDSFTLSINTRVHTFKNLPAADLNGNAYIYAVKETGSENGKVVHAGYRYTVTGDGTVTDGTVTLINTLDRVDVTVTKKWVLNGIQLTFKPELKMTLTAGGEEYGVLCAADNTITATSDDTYTFKAVPYRTDYQVVEALTGHGKALINGKETNIHGIFEESQTAAVGEDFKALITNTAKRAAITVQKTANRNGLDVTVPEFTFTVTVNGVNQTVTLQPAEEQLTVCKQVLIDIPTTDVVVTETTVTGWAADKTQVTLGKDQIVGQNAQVVAAFTNTREKLPLENGTTLTITKTISGDTADKTQELFDFIVTVPADLKNGAVITFEISDGTTTVEKTAVAKGSFIIEGIKHGETVTVTSGLPAGTYNVREEQDEDNHYLYKATVTKAEGNDYAFTAINEPVTGSLIVEKRWEQPNGEKDSAFAYGADGKAVVTFGLFTDENATNAYTDANGKAVTAQTNPNGDAIFTGLPAGTYYLKEILVKNADNYVTSSNILKVVVKNQKVVPAAYTFTNALKKTTEDDGMITIMKVVENVKNEALSFKIAYRYALTDTSGARSIVTGTIMAAVNADGDITYTGDTNKLYGLPYGTIVTVTETFGDKPEDLQKGDAWTTTVSTAVGNEVNTQTTRTATVTAGANNQTVTVTNTRKEHGGDGILTVTKEWIDAANKDGLRPTDLGAYVKLYSHVHGGAWGESIYGTQQINETQTEIKYTNLPAYDLNGKLLTYAVKEDAMSPYVADNAGYVLDGGKIVNTLYTTLKVTKDWRNVEGNVINGARDVAVDVLNGGKIVAAVTLPVNELTGMVSVPKYDAQGNAYVYSVKEVGEADGEMMVGDVKYKVEYANTDGYNHTVTNTKQAVEKTSVSEAGMTVQVEKDGKVIDLVKVGGKITYTITYGNYSYKTADVTVSDTLAAGLAFVENESTPGAVVDGQKITWSMEDVPARTRGTITLVAIVTTDALKSGVANPELKNTATITVGNVEEETTTAVETIYNPAWTVDKKVVNKGSGENGKFTVKDTIKYEITVINTGNVDLTLHVKDTFTVDGEVKTLDLANANSLNPESFELKVGETAVFTASYKIEADDKTIVNAVVTSDDDPQTPDQPDEEKTDVEPNPKWTVEKTADKTTAKVGDVVTYTITVTNTGNVDLQKLTIEDTFKVDGEPVALTLNNADQLDPVAFALAKGDKAIFTATYTVKAEDNELYNAVVVYDDKEEPDDPKDEVTTPVEDKSAWTTEKKVVSKDADNDVKYAPGETIRYEITVTNTGNTKLEGLKVEDVLKVDGVAAELTEGLKAKGSDADPADFTLEEGKSVTFTAAYTVKATDNKVTNVAITSKGDDKEPSDEVETDVEPTPDWTVVKTADKETYKVGETVKYTITVTNTGNTTLKLKLEDTFKVDGDEVKLALTNAAGLNPAEFELAEGKDAVFTATYGIEADDAKLVNVAVTSDDDPETPDKSDPEENEVDPNPKWKVEKTITNKGTGKDGAFKAGDEVEYTIAVTNTGNVDLTKLCLTDLIEIDEKDPVALDVPAESKEFDLAKGATKTFVVTYTVQPADKTLVNTAVVTDEDGDEEKDTTDPVEIEDNPAWDVEKVVSNTGTGKGSAFKVGDTVEYTITVTNTGNVDLTKLSLTDLIEIDDEAPVELEVPEAAKEFDLAKGTTKTFVVTYTVQPTDKTLVNTAVVTDEDGDEEKDTTDPEEIEDNPAWTVDKEVSNEGEGSGKDGAFTTGDLVKYTVTVTNTGNVNLPQLTIVDTFKVDGEPVTLTLTNVKGLNPEAFPLDKGETAVFTATYTIRDEDKKLVNTVVVNDGDDDPRDSKDEVTTEVDENPKWTIKKEIVDPQESYGVDETIVYQITVTNTGNIDLDGMNVSDLLTVDEMKLISLSEQLVDTGMGSDKLGEGETAANFTLEKGKNIIFTVSYTVTATDTSVSNTAVAERDDEEEVDKPDDPRIDPNPKWSVHKAVTSSGSGTDGAYLVGEVVKYEITVTNTGNMDLTGMSLTDTITVDDKESVLALAHPTKKAAKFDLAKNESITFTAEYTVTATDNLIKNIAAATHDGTPVDSNEVVTKVEPTPAWTVNKEVTNEGTGTNKLFKVGDSVQYKITVTNTGNCELPHMTLIDTFEVDSLAAELTLSSDAGLDPADFKLAEGETAVFTASYVVEDNDSLLINKVIASDNDQKTPDPEDKERTEIDRNPKWTVDKTVDKETCKVGDTVTYTIAVKNTGNIYLPKLTILDTFLVDGMPVELELTNARGLNPASFGLAKGATVFFTATYTVAQTDAKLVNAVVVKDNDKNTDDPEDEVITEVDPNPDWTVAKTVVNTGSGENGAFRTGDTIEYEITVKNTGNVDLTDLTLEDIFEVDGEIKQLTLEPSAESFGVAKYGSVTFTSSYTIQATDNELVNTAKVGDEESEIITEIEDCPDYAIEKTVANTGSGENGAFKVGDTVIYKIVVKNTGNTDLKGLSVKDEFFIDGMAADVALRPDASSIDLKEGETAEFTAEYTIKAIDKTLVNSVTVIGDEGDREDEVIVDVEPNEAVTVKKEVINNGSGKNYQFMVGDKIRYRVTVTNVGNVDLKDLTLVDVFKVNGWTKELELPDGAAKFDLVKGETVVFNYSYLIREGDERLVNAATVLETSDKVTIEVTDDPAASADIPPAVGYTYNVGDCFD